MDYINVLKELGTYSAVSGNEHRICENIKVMFEKYCDEVKVDRLYNVMGCKKGHGSKKKIMITAHMDEIGFIVKSIDENGFLKLSGIGGIDSKIMPAQEVIIHGRKDIPGVIGAKPPHLLKPEEMRKAAKMADLSVDTGMGPEEVKEYVTIGDMVTFRSEPIVLQGNRFSSKSMDNRCGVAALLGMMSELVRIKHEQDIYFVATTREETDLAGITIAAYNMMPDMAIVVDTCHGDMPDGPKDVMYPLGKGPAVGMGPNLHRNITKKMMEAAKNDNIPYQIDIEPGDSGTEAWATQVSRCGIPTILVSIPLRYMHTPVETIHTGDIKNAVKMVVKFVGMDAAEMEEMLCY